MFRPRRAGALKPFPLPAHIPDKRLNPNGNNFNPRLPVNIQHPLECIHIIKIRVYRAQFNLLNANLFRQLRNLEIVLEMTETIALNAEISRGGYSHARKIARSASKFQG